MVGEAELGSVTKLTKKHKKGKNAVTVKIEMVREQPDKIPPLVGYFPSGFNPHTRDNSQSDVKVYRNMAKQNRLEVVVSPPNLPSVDFVGKTHEGEPTAHKMCSYAIGVLDKETQKLKIVPIAADKVFRLEPVVRGLRVSDKISAGSSTVARADQIRDLTNTYGTSKAKKGVQKALQLRLKDDISSQPDLQQQLEEAIDKEALASTSAEVSRNIPPYDISATTPEAAYPIEKIILLGEWDYLLDVWENMQAGREFTPDQYPTFICNRVYKLDLIKDESEKTKLACIMSFINHLIKFKEKNSLDGHPSAKNHKVPGILHQRFTAMFADTDKRRLSDDKISLLIGYVLVLTLFIDNFETIPEDITKDLRMPQTSLRVHFENLGCKYGRRSNTNIVTLPVPLQFTAMRRKRRR